MEYQRKILAMFASGKEVGCGDVEGGVGEDVVEGMG